MIEESKFLYYRRAHESIAQGSLTNSKRVECLIKGITPTHVSRGAGAHLFTPDHKKYLDFICGLGTNLLGYANPHINQAIADQMHKGVLFSLGSVLEIEAAEKVKEIIPFCKKIRFVKTGTEACLAAVRIARAHTNRNVVLSEGYHGWSDQFVGLADPALGVFKHADMQKLEKMEQITEAVACVIIEPVITDHSPARLEWIDALISKCKSTGTLVIFDEIITGIRWPNWTFSNDSGRRPDIICLGKAIAGGLPLGVVGLAPGIGDNHEWFVSGSYAGETLSLAAMLKTLDLMRSNYNIKELWSAGARFLESFNNLYPDKLRIDGYPTRGVFVGDPLTKALFWQEAVKAGMIFGPSFFFNFPHIEHADSVISSARDILTRIKLGAVKLEGEMPQTPFAQKVRGS